MTPAPGDYMVVATNGRFGGLIRTVTHSWANHAAILVDDDGTIIQAQPGGVAYGHVDDYDGLRLEWSSRDLSHDQREVIIGAAQGMLGIPYGFLDIAAILLRVEAVHVGSEALEQAVDRRLNRGDRLICSQLVARAYRAAGVNLVPNLADNYVHPGLLALPRTLTGVAP